MTSLIISVDWCRKQNKKFRNVQEKNWGHEKMKIKKADDFARFLNINRRRVIFSFNFLMNIYTRPDFITCVWRVSLTRRQLTRWPAQPSHSVLCNDFPPGRMGFSCHDQFSTRWLLGSFLIFLSTLRRQKGVDDIHQSTLLHSSFLPNLHVEQDDIWV